MSEMSNKLRADYIELINDSLDKAPIQKLEDFDKVINLLENIITPQSSFDIDEAFNDWFISISEYLTEPELFVEQEYQSEFKEIIKERINAKIEELKRLSVEQRQSLIGEREKNREIANANQEKMSSHTAPMPGSSSHTMSDEQWLQHMQQQWVQPIQQELSPIEQYIAGGLLTVEQAGNLIGLWINNYISRF